jgi:hypothetical protein
MARDWESFFEALITFFENFLPILIKLIGIFGMVQSTLVNGLLPVVGIIVARRYYDSPSRRVAA